ncbi:hypothetical protein D3C86_2019490 [compost metagenome]
MVDRYAPGGRVMFRHRTHVMMHPRHRAHGIFLQRNRDQRCDDDQQDREQRDTYRDALPWCLLLIRLHIPSIKAGAL